jgi:pilus assembly protein CpaE
MSTRGFTSDDSNAVMHAEFMAFVTDDESLGIMRNWAERQGFPAATVQSGGPDMFAHMLESSAPPKMAMVDIDSQSDPAGITARLISLCGADCKLIAVGSANDVSLYRQMLNAGAVDYLVKPLAAENLNQAMASALRGHVAGKSETKEARLIIIIGSRGGVGASTIAVNTGWLLAHELKFNCALLDLDLQFGTTSLALDLEPGRGLRDIVNSPQRVDGLMIASSIVPESEQFSVLGAEEAVDEFVQMDSGAITALLKEMTSNFDYIVVDLPKHLLAAQKRLLTSAHEIVLVTELSLAGIRDTLRIKTALNSLSCTATLTVVASRMGPTRAGQVDPTAFEKGAQIKIDLTIPEDHKSVTLAANGGKALGSVARNAPVTKALMTLAQKLSSGAKADAPKAGSGLLGKIFGDGGKKLKPKGTKA